jgi:hypothetical protein
MKRLPLFLLSIGFVPLAINFFVPSSQAQTTKDEQVNKTIQFTSEGKEPVEFNVNGTIDRVNPAAVVGAISLGGGVELDPAQTGINFALAGADPESVSNLMLALAGMISGGNEVDPTRYALAINAFNTIVDKADLNTLTALKEIPEFTDIRTLLADLRNNKAN